VIAQEKDTGLWEIASLLSSLEEGYMGDFLGPFALSDRGSGEAFVRGRDELE